MGRELRRVPLDFDYPLNEVWYGFFIDSIPTCVTIDNSPKCEKCKKMAAIKRIPFTSYGCPDFDTYLEETMNKLRELLAPPKGSGYQLWETTSEGSPVSPVFETLDELCEWCEKNATTFAHFKATKEEWRKMLENNDVFHQERNLVFI